MLFKLKELAFMNSPNQAISAGSGSLSIGEFDRQKLIVDIYPNPGNGENLQLNCSEECSVLQLKIYDIAGQLVLKQKRTKPAT